MWVFGLGSNVHVEAHVRHVNIKLRDNNNNNKQKRTKQNKKNVGTSSQRSRLKQYGFNDSQLQWPVGLSADFNFADDMAWLRAPSCGSWDRHSVALEHRPFSRL